MNKLIIKSSFVLSIWLTSISFLYAQNFEWTQYRGSEREGFSPEKLNLQNSDTPDLQIVWNKKIGSGFSEVCYKNNLLYTMISEAVDSSSGTEYLASFDAQTGKELWRVKVDSLYFDPDGWGNGSRATPAIDDEFIFCFSAFGKLSAHQISDGNMIWQKDFADLYHSTEPRWGFSSSPLLVGDLVIMEVGGVEDKAFIGFDKKSGEIVWNKAQGDASFNSPLFANIDGQDQIIFANGITLYSFKPNGDTLWTFTMPFRSIITIPLLIDKNKIFLSGIRTPGFVIVEINENRASEVLRGNSMKTDFNACVYHDGYIYGFHVAALRCISAETGEVKWTKRGYGKGSLILVDGNLMVLSDQGKIIMVEATPEAYIEKASIEAMEGKSWTAPSFVNGRLYVRNLTEMTCVEIK